MEPRAFGSGSLTVEHRSSGDVEINKERVKLTDSFDSLMEKLKDCNAGNVANIVLEPSLTSDVPYEWPEKPKCHVHEKLNKDTLGVEDTYNDTQPQVYSALNDNDISWSNAGSPTMTTFGCNVDPEEPMLAVYEKLNKATMEATMAPGDSKQQSQKQYGQDYEQLNRDTMESEPDISQIKRSASNSRSYGYEPFNRK